MCFERVHHLETDIIASSFVSVFHAESSSNEERFHISDGSCSELVSECEPETSGSSTSYYSDYVVLNAPQNLMNDRRITMRLFLYQIYKNQKNGIVFIPNL